MRDYITTRAMTEHVAEVPNTVRRKVEKYI